VASIFRHEERTERRILKFCFDQEQHKLMRRALRVAEPFVEAHLAKVERERIPLGGEKCAVYLRIAADDVHRLASMEELRAHGRVIDYSTIIKAVIGEWNQDKPSTVNRSVRAVVSGIVGRRREPVLRWIRAERTAAHLDDVTPVSFLVGGAGRHIVQGLLIGNAHGDLSSRNILIPADPDVRSDGGFTGSET